MRKKKNKIIDLITDDVLIDLCLIRLQLSSPSSGPMLTSTLRDANPGYSLKVWSGTLDSKFIEFRSNLFVERIRDAGSRTRFFLEPKARTVTLLGTVLKPYSVKERWKFLAPGEASTQSLSKPRNFSEMGPEHWFVNESRQFSLYE